MKKTTIALLVLTASVLRLPAAVPLSWTVETTRAQPATFEAYQGETLTFEAALQAKGKPLEAPLNYSFFWQTNGMDSTYWEVPCTSKPQNLNTSNILYATWFPAYDVGARVYNCFIGAPSNIYHAAFQLRLRPSPGATPNALPLPTPVIDFSMIKVINPPWTNVLGTVNQYAPYLWQVDFDDSYTNSAAWYYDRIDGLGGCSARRSGNVLERNYDWNYDHAATFVVRISSGPGRFGSVGVASLGTNLTDRIVASGERSALYRCLPGSTLDGVNERSVAAEINVVATNGSRWETDRDGRDINAIGAVRWVLDHATSAEMAATSLARRVYIPTSMTRLGYSAHFMIADELETWIVEDGEARMVGTVGNAAVMTNYRVFADDDPYGTGYERHDLLAAGESITNAWFRNAYRRPFTRLSEFAAPGVGTHTETNKLQWYADTYVPEGAPESLTRNGKSWQTVHTSIYNISNRILRVSVQETDDWYVFNVPVGGTDENRVREIAEAVVRPVEITAAQALDEASTANTHAIMAQATADTAKVLAQTAQDTADNAASAAEEAQGTAEAAQTAADNAQTAADTAQATADTAQSTADQAVTDAANAQATADQAEDDAQAAISLASGMIPSLSPSDESAGWDYDPYNEEWVLAVESSDSGSTKVLVSPSDVSIVYDSEWSSYRISLTSLSSEMSYISGDYYYLSDEIYRHKANYDDNYNYNPNPHGVTAHDVGSPTVEEVEQRISNITPLDIGAATQADIESAINGDDPRFKSQVIAAGLNIDPHAAEEINRIIERGSFESNCTVVVRNLIDGDREVRRLIVASAKLYWDPGLQVTWQIDVTNGMFYSHIVSDQNLVNRIP